MGLLRLSRTGFVLSKVGFANRLFVSTVIAIVCFWLAVFPGFAASFFEQGMTAYKKQNYSQAVTYFRSALGEDPSDSRRPFYLGLALARNGELEAAKVVFEELLKGLPPGSDLAQKARKNIEIVTKAQMVKAQGSSRNIQTLQNASKSGGSDQYLAHALLQGKVIHFDPAKMPLRVYIADGTKIPGWSPSYKNLVKQAMNEWQSAMVNKIRFVAVQDLQKADIIVRWAGVLPHNFLGVSPHESIGDLIIRSDVTIALNHPVTKELRSADKLKTTILHEFGHALGIKGHSPYPDDVMYYAETGDRPVQLSSRDKKTMAMVYKLDADTTNTLGVSTVKSKQYVELISQGAKKALEKNYRDALVFFEKALAINQHDPDLHYHMGFSHHMLGETADAMRHYQQALNLKHSYMEAKYNLGILLVNEGVRYGQNRQISLARQNFEEAVRLFEEVQQSPKAPSETARNLETARNNLRSLPP